MARTQQKQQKQKQKQKQRHKPQQDDQPYVERHHEGHHILPIWKYLVVFFALMVLLIATVAVNWIFPEGGPLAVTIAVAIAATKMVIILLWFMHVKFSSRLIWLAATAAFFWLGIMFVLTLSDYISRPWLQVTGH